MEDAPAGPQTSQVSEPAVTQTPSEGEANITEGHFKHTPLDREKASIRLLEVLPALSSQGYIQCTIRHTDVEDTYTCLSYVWGEISSERHRIIINERLFRVHHNLWEFLTVARIRYHSIPLWIDAVCIDQDAVLERNHQVQLMGDIFSSAIQVVAWLGNGEETVSFMALLRDNPGMLAAKRAPEASTQKLRHAAVGFQQFSMLKYWQRAWITQEIALAQTTTFLSGHEELDISQLPSNNDKWTESAAGKLACRTPSPKAERSVYRMLNQLILPSKRYSLVHLLDLFAYKDCHIDRDRIYSLLSICTEGSNLVPDYRIPDEEVLIRTLQCCFRSLCFCTVGLVASVLNINKLSHGDYYVEFEADKPWFRDWSVPIGGDSVLPCDQRCPRCRVPYSQDWVYYKKRGYTLCLSAICEEFRGHLFFEMSNPLGTVAVEAHVSLPLQVGAYPHFKHNFQIDIDIQKLSQRQDSLYKIRFRLEDLLRMVIRRGKWWRRSHTHEQQYRGLLWLEHYDTPLDLGNLSRETVKELLGSGPRLWISDFELRRKWIQGTLERCL